MQSAPTLARLLIGFGRAVSGRLMLGSSGSVSVGQTLTMSDGTQYGTVVAGVEAHQFPNGAVEPGVLVDYGPRIPDQQNWLPTRSAATMVQ